MNAGRLLGNVAKWRTADAFGVAAQAIDLGVRRVLVLDLARVGVGTGTGTEALCARLTAAFPHVEISAGGGVRGVDDLRLLRNSGVQNVLVASALHDGRLTPNDLTGRSRTACGLPFVLRSEPDASAMCATHFADASGSDQRALDAASGRPPFIRRRLTDILLHFDAQHLRCEVVLLPQIVEQALADIAGEQFRRRVLDR